MKKTVNIKVLSLVLGIFLLGLNFIGFFIPLRNADIYTEEENYFPNDIVHTEDELEQVLDLLKNEKESDKEFIIKANKAVHDGIAHYWKDAGINKYNLRIPIYENYILYIASYLYPEKFRKYEFSDFDKAIERGVGLCSQHALILSEVLENNGIDAEIITLPRHVVVSAEVKDDNEWWVVDPDFGVIIENTIQEIEKTPSIVSPIYYAKGYDNQIVNDLTETYGTVLSIHDSAKEYSGVKRFYFEKLSYILIWALPLFLIGVAIFLSRRQRLINRR